MNNFKHNLANNKQIVSLFIVGFFLLCGVIFYALDFTFVLRLTPIIISAIAALMILFWENNPKVKVYLSLGVIAIGTIAEYIGVHSGLLFGEYTYTNIVGYLIWGVPFIIGVLWFIVSLSAWNIVNYGKLSTIKKIILASVLLVMLDLVLEQFATAYGLWNWKNGEIPILNYLSWFGVSVVLMALYNKFDKSKMPSIFNAAVLPLLASFFWLMLIFK